MTVTVYYNHCDECGGPYCNIPLSAQRDSGDLRVISDDLWAKYVAAQNVISGIVARIEQEGQHTDEYEASERIRHAKYQVDAKDYRAMASFTPSEEAIRSKFPPEWVAQQDEVLSTVKGY